LIGRDRISGPRGYTGMESDVAATCSTAVTAKQKANRKVRMIRPLNPSYYAPHLFLGGHVIQIFHGLNASHPLQLALKGLAGELFGASLT